MAWVVEAPAGAWRSCVDGGWLVSLLVRCVFAVFCCGCWGIGRWLGVAALVWGCCACGRFGFWLAFGFVVGTWLFWVGSVRAAGCRRSWGGEWRSVGWGLGGCAGQSSWRWWGMAHWEKGAGWARLRVEKACGCGVALGKPRVPGQLAVVGDGSPGKSKPRVPGQLALGGGGDPVVRGASVARAACEKASGPKQLVAGGNGSARCCVWSGLVVGSVRRGSAGVGWQRLASVSGCPGCLPSCRWRLVAHVRSRAGQGAGAGWGGLSSSCCAGRCRRRRAGGGSEGSARCSGRGGVARCRTAGLIGGNRSRRTAGAGWLGWFAGCADSADGGGGGSALEWVSGCGPGGDRGSGGRGISE